MKGTTVLKIALFLLGAVFLIHQAISSLYKPVKTQTVVYDTVSDGQTVTGVVLRNETPVVSKTQGVTHFLVGDGSHVSKNGVIANLYDSESASITLTRLTELTQQQKELKELLHYNDLQAADLDLLSTKVSEALDLLILSGATGDYTGTQNAAEGLLSACNKRQAALGDTARFSEQLTALQKEIDLLSKSLPSAKGKITASRSGYFVSKTDGYENVLNGQRLDEVTPEFMEKLSAEKLPDTVVGKIVSDYEWYIAASMPVGDSLNYKEGDRLNLLTSVKSYPKLSVKVKQINMSKDSLAAVVIFSCDDMNSELASIRTGVMTVVRKETSGLRVAKSALRVVDSVKGVYVVSGIQAKFVPVNILYSNDSSMICEQQTGTELRLRLYDEVIVKGKRLYDGKVIR